MTLPLVFFMLTLAVTASLVWPLLRRRHATSGHEKRDIAVYREQLTEVDNDIERGLLTKTQAEAVRTEIHRRMLAVEDAELADKHGKHRPVSPRMRKVFAGLIIVLLPVTATALYLLLGAPELPGKPYASRANDPEFALASNVKDMQFRLDQAPSAEGYKHLANTLYMMKRYAESTAAYQKAIDLGDNKALTWSEMGESVVLNNDGSVMPEALGDFYKALKIDPRDARALFYIGLGEAQINNLRKAVSIWKVLQKDSSPDAPWFAMVNEHIAAYSKEGGFDPASIEPSQPTALASHGYVSTHPEVKDQARPEEAMPSAEAVTGENMPAWAKDPKSRDAMIKSMVDGLAAKLEKNHGDVEGWMKLVNAYHVLGETDKAQKALDEALRFNPGNTELKTLADSFSSGANDSAGK